MIWVLIGSWLLVMGIIMYIKYRMVKQHWLDAREVIEAIRARGKKYKV